MTMPAPLRPDGHLARLADRAQRWAEETISETAYALSYQPGTTRYYQARKRAETAEQKMLKAFDALRAAIARAEPQP